MINRWPHSFGHMRTDRNWFEMQSHWFTCGRLIVWAHAVIHWMAGISITIDLVRLSPANFNYTFWHMCRGDNQLMDFFFGSVCQVNKQHAMYFALDLILIQLFAVLSLYSLLHPDRTIQNIVFEFGFDVAMQTFDAVWLKFYMLNRRPVGAFLLKPYISIKNITHQIWKNKNEFALKRGLILKIGYEKNPTFRPIDIGSHAIALPFFGSISRSRSL